MTDDVKAENAEERGQGICRTCLRPIWNEGGTIGHSKRPEGWSDRVERGGDSLVCFKARDYRHVPLEGREACIYDMAVEATRREVVDWLEAHDGVNGDTFRLYRMARAHYSIAEKGTNR